MSKQRLNIKVDPAVIERARCKLLPHSIDADYLVTRNERDFKSAPVHTCTPSTILSLL